MTIVASVTTEKFVVRVESDATVTIIGNVTSALSASMSASAAGISAAAAAVAQAAAEAAEGGAETAEATAAAAADTATTQAGTAAAAADTATTQAGTAAAAADTATTQAGTATTQAGIATTQAGIATTKAGEASASAAAASADADAAEAAVADVLASIGTALAAGTYPASFTTLKASDNIALAATSKLYMDGIAGTGDTYLVETSGNTLDIFSGGIRSLRAASGALTLGFDGSYSHTINGTVAQAARNNADAYNITGATTGWTAYRIANTAGNLYMGVASSAGVLFTGSSAYSAGIGTTLSTALEFATNATVRAAIGASGGFALAATGKLYLDGVAASGDTYITESAANTLDIYSGGSRAIRVVGAEVSMAGALNTSGLTGSAYSFNGTVNFIAGSTGGHGTITLVSGTSSAGYFAFADGTGTPDRYAGLIAYYHNTNLMELRASGTPVVGITQTTVGIPAAAKLCLDGISGAGDTYLVESSANVLDLHAGGVKALSLNASYALIEKTSAYPELVIRANTSGFPILTLLAAGASGSYVTFNNNLRLGSVTGVSGAGFDDKLNISASTGNVVMKATAKLHLDGASGAGGDTYLVETSANVLDMYAGGVKALSLTTAGAAVTGVIATTDPAGGAGPAWKLGVAATVSPTAPNRTLRVDVAGTSYYLAAKTTND